MVEKKVEKKAGSSYKINLESVQVIKVLKILLDKSKVLEGRRCAGFPGVGRCVDSRYGGSRVRLS